MNVMLVIGTLLGALAVIGCRLWSRRLRLAVDVLAVVSLCGFEMISAIAVTDIIRHDEIYATKVHEVFDNSLFLAFGAYLGVYGLGRLIWHTIAEYRGGQSRI